MLRGQEALFGVVASETTAHRVLKSIDAGLLEAIRAARAKALARAWDAGARPEELILDIDASLLIAHSEKEGAAGNYKGGFGFHPLLCYLAETGEPLAGILRPGNAAAHTAADHFEVLQLALEQLPGGPRPRDPRPRRHRRAHPCLHAGLPRRRDPLLGRLRGRRAGARGDRELPDSAWQSAIDGEGEVREGAQVTELTDHVDLSSWPEGTRLIVRRERPHPGAQLSVFDCESGYRHTAFITDQAEDDIAALELRHRRRARVEDAIRVGKETGMRKMPFAAFAHNQAWLEVSLLAQALLRWAASALPGRRARARRAQAGAPAPAARRRADRSLGPAGGAAAAAKLALGRGAGRGLRAAAGAARHFQPIIAAARPPITLPRHAAESHPAREQAETAPTRGKQSRNERWGAPGSPPWHAYLPQASHHTPQNENGGSRLAMLRLHTSTF